MAVWIVHRSFGGIVSAGMLVLLLGSNLLSINLHDDARLRWPLPGYLYEISHGYPSPYDTVVSYLKVHAAKNDIVYAEPEHTMNVLHCYLGDSLIVGSLLRRDSPLPVERLRSAGYPAYIDEYYPDWIVSFGMNERMEAMLDYFSRGPFSYRLDRNIAVFWNDLTRPELPWHSFMPVRVPERSVDGIFIYKKEARGAAKK
jgi:hypothetical protein